MEVEDDLTNLLFSMSQGGLKEHGARIHGSFKVRRGEMSMRILGFGTVR